MSSVFQKLSSERRFLWILVVALLLPLGLSRLKGTPFLGLPLITSGDEPHYLVMIHSLLDDGDLDLDNNYLAARRGSLAVGQHFSGAPLDRHVEYYTADGKPYQWSELFEYPRDPSQPDGFSRSVAPKRGVGQSFAGHPQYSQHPAGLPLLLAPALYPVRGTRWVEHLAVFLGTLATFGLALGIRQLLRLVSDDAGVVNTATLVTALGSPVWHYGRVLFTEPWLALFAVMALVFALRREAFLLAGCCIALGMQMKPPFALIAAPLLLDRLLARDVRRLLVFSLPIAAGAALVLVGNQHFFGSPLRSAQPWASGSLLEGMAGLLLSWNHGLIPFAPAVVVALFGWRELFRSHRRVAWLCAATFASYYLLMSLWSVWGGGYCYGPRYLVPVIPFTFLGLVRVFESLPTRSVRFQRRVAVMCALSVGISAAGALLHLAFWDKHPLVLPFMLLAKRL